MKLLLLIPSLGSGGAERQMVNLSILFKNKGIHVEFLIYHKDLFYLDFLTKNGIKVNILEEKNYLDRILKVMFFIKNYSPTCVISFLETCDFLNCISSIFFPNYKVITTELSCKVTTFTTIRGKIIGWFRRYSDYLVCNSYNAKKIWMKYHSNYEKLYEVIYNPVLVPKITSEYIFKRNEVFNLVVAASYQYLKNPIGLIEAVSKMDKEKSKFLRIDWYGRIEISKSDTKAYDEACELIIKYNLENIIYLHEETKDIANIMNSADAVGLFSYLEGLPNAICEAMIIGKPIIMSRVSDFDVLVGKENGFLCDPDDISSISLALESIIDMKKDNLLRLGYQSKLKAQKLFSNDIVLEKWMNLIS
ncbi:glycosyltransferase [Acinetobacter kookii]